jgi:hypothetical protein
MTKAKRNVTLLHFEVTWPTSGCRMVTRGHNDEIYSGSWFHSWLDSVIISMSLSLAVFVSVFVFLFVLIFTFTSYPCSCSCSCVSDQLCHWTLQPKYPQDIMPFRPEKVNLIVVKLPKPVLCFSQDGVPLNRKKNLGGQTANHFRSFEPTFDSC